MFDVQMSLEAAVLLIVAVISPVVVALVRRLGPSSWRARFVTVGVVGVLAVVVAIATNQVPTPWADQVAQAVVYAGVILAIGQAIHRLFGESLDRIASGPSGARSDAVS